MEEFSGASGLDLNSSPETISAEEWDLLCAVEEFWHRHRVFPSVVQIRQIDPKLNEKFVIQTFQTSGFQERLERRGIDFNATGHVAKGELKKNDSRLSDKQLAVAMCLLNVADTRSIQNKLRSLGVSNATYSGWMKSQKFSEFMKAQMEEMFGSSLPLVHKALIDKAVSGDYKSIKLVYEMTGRWRGVQSQDNENVKLLIMRLIEIIQKYVRDPAVLQLIANDMKTLSPESFGVSGGFVEDGSHTTIRAELTGGV